METKTQFGIGSFAKHAPKWVVPSLSIAILVIGTAQFLISGDPGITPAVKERVSHYLTGIGMLITAIAPFFGVDLKQKK